MHGSTSRIRSAIPKGEDATEDVIEDVAVAEEDAGRVVAWWRTEQSTDAQKGGWQMVALVSERAPTRGETRGVVEVVLLAESSLVLTRGEARS